MLERLYAKLRCNLSLIALTSKFIDSDAQNVRVSYGDDQMHRLDFTHFCEIDEGVKTALFDCWLADSDFCDAYGKRCAWALRILMEAEEERVGWLNEFIGVESNEETNRLTIARTKDAVVELDL